MRNERYGTLYCYNALLLQIAEFLNAGKSRVSPTEILQIIAFMEAADESKRKGGVPVSLDSSSVSYVLM